MATHQINSRQCEQKVGWRRKVAMNLWPLTWWTRLRMAPRRRFMNGCSLLFGRRHGTSFGWSLSKIAVALDSGWFLTTFDRSPWDHRRSILTCNFPDGSRSTQKSSCCCCLRAIKSSNVIVVLALKTSSIGALWNTVMPSVLAFSTSWINSSFQTGSNVFCLILDRSEGGKKEVKDKI